MGEGGSKMGDDGGRGEEVYEVNFRHSGMKEPEKYWGYSERKRYTLNELLSEVAHHTVTHLSLEGSIIRDIDSLFPQLTHLYLSSLSIDQISSATCRSINQLKNLQTLYLSDNDFSKGLPDDIFTSSMTSLRELNISRCKLTTLPRSVNQLRNLQTLDISRNDFSKGLPDDIFTSSMASLRVLNIFWCELTTLPRSINQLRNLQTLNISDNDFSKGLPDDIFTSMTSLRELNISMSKLTTLPKSIYQLRNLQSLRISSNDFSKGLPDDIFTSSITSLRELNISRCKLTTFPRSIYQLRNLQTLYISNNDFSKGLPDDIFTSSMTSLRELSIYGCKLTTLPRSVNQLRYLQTLCISENNFSKGLPDDIFTSSMTSLRELNISGCKLTTLPRSIRNLQQLVKLDISNNKLSVMPSVVCELKGLEVLDIMCPRNLKHLNPKILQMTSLKSLLNIEYSQVIISPPYEICRQRLEAIIQYYVDLEKGQGRNLPMVTIAVIGKSSAGKTSLIRTLQSADRKRVLTIRDPKADVDETTKVFKVEEVEVDGMVLRLIDMGGQGVYHITYQLTLKKKCIPVFVVSMEQYHHISKESSPREAVRRCAFDYLSHLYLANPDLVSPKLVFTHHDKFSVQKFNELRTEFIKMSNELCQEIVQEEKTLGGQFCQIRRFCDSTEDIFLSDDIYEVGVKDHYSVFDSLKTNLFVSCKDFTQKLPKLWEEVNDLILSMPSVYNTFDEIFSTLYKKDHTLSRRQISIILQYMHDCGKILWYKDIEFLQPFYFHKIAEVTKLLCVFYHHDVDRVWQSRRDNFRARMSSNSGRLEREHFDSFVARFKETGVMDKELLVYLIESETGFTSKNNLKVAITLLTTFQLLYGPITADSRRAGFIIPYFAVGHSTTPEESNEGLIVQVDLLFKGLSLPQYVYYQMIVGFLELFPSTIASKTVRRNGARIYFDGFDMQLVHDYKSRKASIYVSSAARNICGMWKKLIDITNNTLRHVKEAWPASRPVTVSYCAHCLLVQNPHPEKVLDPEWSTSQHRYRHQVLLTKTSSTLICKREEIFAILQHPCASDSLPEAEVKIFEDAVSQMKARGRLVASERNQPATRPIGAASSTDEELSDFSDDDENIYPEEANNHLVSLNSRAKPVTNSRIEDLFSDTDKVFKMTRKRGRALIINNENFEERPDICRKGSEADVQNMADMLKELKFEVKVRRDLKAEVMLSTIKAEVEHKVHEDMGCHVLVIMSHGTADNRLFGADMKLVNLTHVFDLLTPINFPGMSGKPKVVIIEACSGDRIDVGPKGIHPNNKSVESGQQVKYETVEPPPSQIGRRQEAESMESLNYDDLLVIKASAESFISKRHPVYGCLMIRALVSTMYKHACHRDVYEIFKQVQRLVRGVCIKKKLDDGQLPVVWDTLTHGRKLYLFPGFNGHRRRGSNS